MIRYEGPAGGPGHARDAARHRCARRRGPRRRGRADHRRPLLGRDARADGRPHRARGVPRRPDRARARRRHDRARRRERARLDVDVPEDELARRARRVDSRPSRATRAASSRSTRRASAPPPRERRPRELSALQQPLRMPRVAWPIRCSFSTSAKRTCPSPPAPKPMPGLTATSASRARRSANSSEPSAAQLLGDRRPDEHRPARRLDVPAGAGEPGAERVAAAPVDLADLGAGSRRPRAARRSTRSGSAGTCRSRGRTSASRARRRRRRGRATKPTRQPAIENDFVRLYSSTAQSAAPSAASTDGGSWPSKAMSAYAKSWTSTNSCSRARSTSRCISSRRRDRGRRVVRERDDHDARAGGAHDRLLDRVDRRPRRGASTTVAPARRGATRWIG